MKIPLMQAGLMKEFFINLKQDCQMKISLLKWIWINEKTLN